MLHSPEREPTRLAWWQDCAHFLKAVATTDIFQPHPPFGNTPYLRLNRDELELVDERFNGPFRLEAQDVARRAESTSYLCRATGVVGTKFRVLDIFAGFGIDGLALARHANVTLIEQNPIVFVMLKEFADRMSLLADIRLGDGPSQLSDTTGEAYEVVYLDPMFPTRNKKALPNRAMQHLQALDDSEQISEEGVADLVLSARSRALDRVVLKRRLRDPQIDKPNFSLKGRTVRFDVYR